MHTELSPIHEISQNKLKGSPRIMGSMRSHSETEKHIAANGISPSRIAPNDGLFTQKPPFPNRAYGERWRLFGMERAQPRDILPILLQTDVLADDAANVRLLLHAIRK
jgi:hypothetical protein